MTAAFVRQLGSQPGIQLNPPRDNSDGFVPDNSDQVFAIAARLLRGRIDRPFKVNRGNVERKVGKGESIRTNALNEGRVQLVEALGRGAYEAVVCRLVPAAALLKYVVAVADVDGDLSWNVYEELPEDYVIGFRHLECFNDGAIFEVHADAVREAAVEVDATLINVRIREPNGNILLEQAGSLSMTALDDFQRSAYLPDVIETTYKIPEVEVFIKPGSVIAVGSNAYGRGTNGLDNYSSSGVQLYFTEGGTAYVTDDLIRARTQLKNAEFDYKYIASGGTKSPALLAQLAQLANDLGRPMALDVDGTLTPAQAIAFVEQLGLDAYLVRAFWAPLRCDDPLNGGKVVLGTSGLNVAFSCARNAIKDARGFARMNAPIAGKDYPLGRGGITQIYDPDEFELSDLAKAHINPVLYARYSGGGVYVFTDCLTLAKTEASYRKLTTVADMSSTIDDTVCLALKEFLQLPMTETIARGKRFLQKLFEGAQSAGWLVPSVELDGKAFLFQLVPDPVRPVDKVKVTYSLRYDGVTRQIDVTQTISR